MLAVMAAMVGMQPRDELEGMLIAQLIASHNAAMECYRRAMIGEQTFEGRRENLTQANKLSRSYAALVEALDRHRGRGQPSGPDGFRLLRLAAIDLHPAVAA